MEVSRFGELFSLLSPNDDMLVYGGFGFGLSCSAMVSEPELSVAAVLPAEVIKFRFTTSMSLVKRELVDESAGLNGCKLVVGIGYDLGDDDDIVVDADVV